MVSSSGHDHFHFTPTDLYLHTDSSVMSSQKCLSQEFDSLKDATTPTKAAKIHGILSNVSPMKGEFYEASITDANSSKRLVGFHKDQRDKLANSMTQQLL